MNQFGKISNPKDYNRLLVYCNLCKTPMLVDREKDAPRFCPVCHVISSWKNADMNYLKEWGLKNGCGKND